ncbi:uncharacterized protein LOC111259021 isoform X2 [Varroa jacobsoni]|uniref:uncharacterized protein LOC111259021 isoform X2 n=1 Tax=Varroa jacobsoni TaxID=62625 RepID=UPI000BFA039C|nr:uncharacterized protein LOC111259021 isoform X2 [Varroa jacobsoni]
MQRSGTSTRRPTVAPPVPPAGVSPGGAAPEYQCELCKSTRAAIRCDRCENQVFCLQCDDIFHRHPKRKSHLRKSVEQHDASVRPPQSSSATVSQMSGHTVVASTPFWKQQPLSQPNVPPRKKKPFSLLTNLMRGKSEVAIPEEIEKRGTISSKLGSLKRFIQNRPLPSPPGEATPSSPSSFRSGEEPKKNAFECLHNRQAGSTSSLARINANRDLSDWEDNGLLASNLQVNRMYNNPQTASMNRHQSMMDLSRMAPQACQGIPYVGPFGPFGVFPYGAPYSYMPGVPYGSMSYLSDPRMMPHPWGYAGSSGSFSNVNSSAEGEGKDTDTESSTKIGLGGIMGNGMVDPRMSSMRRCQSFASNQWGAMMYPQAPRAAPFEHPMGMVPFGGYPGGNQWGSGRNLQSVDTMPPINPNAQLSNMDANRAIWYYHNRNRQRPMGADTETSDSDIDFIPRSSRLRSDSRQVSRQPSQGDIPRQNGRRGQRTGDSKDSRQSSPRPSSTRASSLGASDPNIKDYSDVDFDEERHSNQGYRDNGRQGSRTPQRSGRNSPSPELTMEEYIDPSSVRQQQPPTRESRSREKDRKSSVGPRRPSYERATKDNFEQVPGNRLYSSQPMSSPRQRPLELSPKPEPVVKIPEHTAWGASVAPRLPEKKLSGKLATDGQSHEGGTGSIKASSRDIEGTETATRSTVSGSAEETVSAESQSSRTVFSTERNLDEESCISTSGPSSHSGSGLATNNDPEPARIRWSPSKQWICIHCTFINVPGVKICAVCCKTSFRDPSPEQAKQQGNSNNGHQENVREQAKAEQTTKAIADKPPSKPVEPAELTEQADPRTSISKDVDGFDYEFVKQQREVEQELRRRLDNERRIAAENAKLERESNAKENSKASSGSNGRDAPRQESKEGTTPYDAYEVVEFTSEAESETESGRSVENEKYPKPRSLVSRFEDKIKMNKEGSFTTVGPYRRMMVNQNGTPKTITSINQARSRFETSLGQTSECGSNSRPRKSSLKGSDLTPSSSRSSLSSEEGLQKPEARPCSTPDDTAEYQEGHGNIEEAEDGKLSDSTLGARRKIMARVEAKERHERSAEESDEAEEDAQEKKLSSDSEEGSENSQKSQISIPRTVPKGDSRQTATVSAIRDGVQQTVTKGSRAVADFDRRQIRPSKVAPTTTAAEKPDYVAAKKTMVTAVTGSKETDWIKRAKHDDHVLTPSPNHKKLSQMAKDNDTRQFDNIGDEEDQSTSMPTAFNLKIRSFRSVADLIEEQRRDLEKENALQLMKAIKEGEAVGFSAEDIQIAKSLCADANPVFWLQTNWAHIIETVIHLANSYVAENALENVGQLSVMEAQAALRRQRGNVWNAVLDSVEKRQAVFQEIATKGPFKPEDILQELLAAQGNIDQAVAQLSNNAMNAFLVKMYDANNNGPSGSEPALSRASSENDVTPDEKIAFWLRNAEPSANSGSSVISSSSESLNLLAGPDLQLHKLDQLMMKRHMQKKEETRYRKYKERIAYTRQHHKRAMVAETGYFKKNPRSLSSMSASSVDQASSVTSNSTNIEKVIEQRIQNGISTILSAIKTAFNKNNDMSAQSNEDNGAVKNEGRQSSKSSSPKSSRDSGGDVECGEEKCNDDSAEVTRPKKNKDVSSGNNANDTDKKDKARGTRRCKRSLPKHKVTDMESEPEKNDDKFVHENPTPKITASQRVQTAMNSDNEEGLEATKSRNHDANEQTTGVSLEGASTATGADNTTEDSDEVDDNDYSELELAVATVTRAVVVSPFEVRMKGSAKSQDSDDSEEFEEASDFLDPSIVHNPEIHHEDITNPDKDRDTSASPVTLNDVNQGVVEGSSAAKLIVAVKADKSKHSKVAPDPASPIDTHKIRTSKVESCKAGPTTDAAHHQVEGTPGQQLQKEKRQYSLDERDDKKSENGAEHEANIEEVPLLKLPQTFESNEDENSATVIAVTESQVENVSEITSSSNPLLSLTLPEEVADIRDIEISSQVVDSGGSKAGANPAKDQHQNQTPLINDSGNAISDTRTTEYEDFKEQIVEQADSKIIEDFLGQQAAYWEEQDRLEREVTGGDANKEIHNSDSADENMRGDYDLYEDELGVKGYVADEISKHGFEESVNDTINLPDDQNASLSVGRTKNSKIAESENPHFASSVFNAPSTEELQPSAMSELPSRKHDDKEDLIKTPVPTVQSNRNTDRNTVAELPSFNKTAATVRDEQIPSDSIEAKNKPDKREFIKRKVALTDSPDVSATVLNSSAPPAVSVHVIPESAKPTAQKDGHDSNDYSDVSGDESDAAIKRTQNDLANQAAMMKVIRRSLEDLAHFGGKPQKIASKHVVYRRPSIRRRSTIVIVDRGDGFGRFPGGDAIIIKPQRRLETAVRLFGQDLTKGFRNEVSSCSRGLMAVVKKSRTQPPPQRRVKDATVLQEKNRAPVSSVKQKEYKERAHELLKSGVVENMEQAQIVAELVDLKFDQDDAILASENTDSVYQAVVFLQQECNICVGTYPMSQMVALLQCPHVACRECLQTYFTIQIREHNISELRCPFCREPDLADEKIEQNYFSNMSVLLKDLLDNETFELFQKRLVERALMKDPNFCWCPQCSSGFITVPERRMVTCPDCKTTMCSACRKTWRTEHESMSCDEFVAWLSREEPDSAEKALETFFEENGIQCPACKFRYALSRGGCMHFKCLQCGFDFCSGCNRPYKHGDKCGFSVTCSRMGLHAHHPRNCLFYLRDKEYDKLEALLKDAGVPLRKDLPPGQEQQKQCPVLETKETALGGYKDGICGKQVEPKMAGVCRKHYIEHLGNLIFKHKIDPWPILESEELELCIRRANMRLPSKYQLTDAVYKDLLRKIVREDIPLDKVDPKQK